MMAMHTRTQSPIFLDTKFTCVGGICLRTELTLHTVHFDRRRAPNLLPSKKLICLSDTFTATVQ